MGENMLRRRNDRFIRQRDARFVEQIRPDLFSTCPPTTVIDLIGTALGEVCNDQELWTPNVPSSGPICFYHGDVAAVTLGGPAADHIRSEYGGLGGAVVAKVIHVEQEHGLVQLRLGSSR